VNEIHVTVLDADHVQSRVVVTSTVPVVPSDGTAGDVVGDTDTWHRAVVGAVTVTDEEEQAANPRPTRTGRTRRAVTMLTARCKLRDVNRIDPMTFQLN